MSLGVLHGAGQRDQVLGAHLHHLRKAGQPLGLHPGAERTQ